MVKSDYTNLSKCAWSKVTGDVICSNYEKSSNHGLNRIKSYLDLAAELTCRCPPSITMCKHSGIESSRICKSKYSKHILRQENAIVLGALQLVVNFALLAYIIVEFNMDKFCERMLVFAFDGKESLLNSHYHFIDCFYDEERSKNRLLDVKSERNGVFWLCAHMKSDVGKDHQKLQGKKVTLQQLVHHSYTLCNLIYDEYKGMN